MNILKEIIAFVMILSPLIAFFIVRKKQWDKNLRIGLGIAIALGISIVCYVLVMLLAYKAT
jgi:hypothetical protein